MDASAAGIVREYGDVIGVVVDKGRHEVTLAFRPEGRRIGRIISTAAAALACAVFTVGAALPRWKA